MTAAKLNLSNNMSPMTKTVKANLKESNEYYSVYKLIESNDTHPFERKKLLNQLSEQIENST